MCVGERVLCLDWSDKESPVLGSFLLVTVGIRRTAVASGISKGVHLFDAVQIRRSDSLAKIAVLCGPSRRVHASADRRKHAASLLEWGRGRSIRVPNTIGVYICIKSSAPPCASSILQWSFDTIENSGDRESDDHPPPLATSPT